MVMSISRLSALQLVLIVHPLVADLFLYSYEADFVQHLQKSKFKKQIKNPLISLFALSLNNPKFNYYIDVRHPAELEIKDTPDAPKWDTYLVLRLQFDEDCRLYSRP